MPSKRATKSAKKVPAAPKKVSQRTNAPPRGVRVLPGGQRLRIGGTNKGGTGRPKNAAVEAYRELAGGAGLKRITEFLEGTPLRDRKGQPIRDVTTGEPILVLPREQTVLAAVELSAKIGRLVGTDPNATPDPIDLPLVEFRSPPAPPPGSTPNASS